MDDWLAERAAELRGLRGPDDDDALWLFFLDDPHGEPVLATAIDGALSHLDSDLISGLAHVLRDVPAKAVLLAVSRPSARPEPADRCLWEELGVALDGATELVDLLVVGDQVHASLRNGST